VTAVRRAAAVLALTALLAAPAARAQFWRSKDQQAGPPPDAKPAVDLDAVRLDEQLGAQVPLDTVLLDWTGKPFTLGSLFHRGRPVVLALVYYDCPMLCGLIQSGMARAFRENGLALGKDYQAVSISFDPAERPALGGERRRGYLQSMGLSDAGEDWPFLVGAEADTRRIADAVGFRYRKDPATGEWAHVAAIVVLSPEGKVSRYLYGIEYPPKDLRLALVEAADGRVGTSFDRLLLTCYRYDPASRRYLPFAFGVVRAGGAVVLVALAGLIAALVARERKVRRTA